MVKAILFDLNGTMIDDMRFHTEAWFEILNNDLKANLTVDEVKKEMYGKNSEVLVRVFGEGKFTEDEMNSLSIEKEKRYQKAFLPELKLINGLDNFLKEAESKQIKMAIASAAIPFNIDFVLDNLHLRNLFGAIVSADDVTTSKPHPETFLKAAHLLGVRAEECVVFEDAPKGVEAAENAGMKTVVLTTMHEKEEFSQYRNVVAFVKDYTDPFFTTLLNE
jgi:beta-phosphoglucomutase family hydrolase